METVRIVGNPEVTSFTTFHSGKTQAPRAKCAATLPRYGVRGSYRCFITSAGSNLNTRLENA
jgi:hypothetical protein